MRCSNSVSSESCCVDYFFACCQHLFFFFFSYSYNPDANMGTLGFNGLPA